MIVIAVGMCVINKFEKLFRQLDHLQAGFPACRFHFLLLQMARIGAAEQLSNLCANFLLIWYEYFIVLKSFAIISIRRIQAASEFGLKVLLYELG